MGYFYFARHGQTVWNVENKICGATDIALTEKGHEQAKELGRNILDEGIHIDGILCVHQITEFFILQLGLQLFQHTIICFAFIA